MHTHQRETTTMTPDNLPPLLRLPLELREHIFSYYFDPSSRLTTDPFLTFSTTGGGGRYKFDFRLLRVNRQICAEARGAWKRCGTFVMVQTPWPTAVHHISTEGFVPIVCSGPKASLFKAHTFNIEITAPRYDADPDHSLVLLLDDIEAFSQTWYYSQLNYPVLNTELHVHFTARPTAGWDAPSTPKPSSSSSTTTTTTTKEGEKDGTNVPIPLQRKFLLPFTRLKSLRGTSFTNITPSISSAVLAGMSEPIPTLQSCLETCAALITEGDTYLHSTPPQPARALESYQNAFHTIHVIIDKRTRHVLAEGFFHEEITAGPFAGQSGSTVRIIFRIRLVSRYVLAYLRLGQYGEAAFWGLRSVRIMQEAISPDFEDFMSEFVGMSEVGPLCARTAIALQIMEEAVQSAPCDNNGPCDSHRHQNAGIWKEEIDSYKGEELASSKALWGLARKYLGNPGKEESKAVEREIKEFGVVVPEGLVPVGLAGEDEVESEVGSMGYMTLEDQQGAGE